MGSRNSDNIFKFVPGLGIADKDRLEKFCAVYALAGADIFDLTPDDEVFDAAFSGIKKVGLNPEKFKFCASFSFGSDVHGRKAFIDKKKCTKCGKCHEICIRQAINPEFEIIPERCVGCGKCSECNAISFYKNLKNPFEFLSSSKYLPDIAELHINGADYDDVYNLVKNLKDKFPKINISLCMTRGILSDKENINIIRKISNVLYPERLTVQADGKSMSGEDDAYCRVLQTVAFAQILKDIDVDIILSGGCNSRTNECLKLFDVKVYGIASGTFAGNLILKYINHPNFWYNENIFNEAVKVAMEFVEREKRC